MRGVLSGARRGLVPLAIFVLVSLAYAFGAFEPVERALMDSRFRLLPRGTSGELVVVAIDSHSLHALNTWPWPRDYHARLIDSLIAAGATKIALDIDFSAISNPSADGALAAALVRAQARVILPAFAQRGALSERSRNDVYNSFPAPIFRPSTLLAAVDVFPGPDSLVRDYSPLLTVDKTPMPSMAALLFGSLPAQPGGFYLDYGIRLDKLTVLSYVDVLDGRFDPAAVAGKKIIVGATAIELGDQFAVPLYRTIAGPLLQALAYECLAQGRAVHRSGALPTLGLALLILIGFQRPLSARGWRRGLLALLAVAAMVYGTALAVQALAPFSFDLAPALAGAVALFAIGVVRELELQARAALKHRTSDQHRRAMMQCVLEDSFDGIIIARADGTIELVNPAGSRFFGCGPEDMAGKPIDLFLPGSTTLQDQALAARRRNLRLPAGSHMPVERQLAGPDGKMRTVEHVASCSQLRIVSHQKERHAAEPHVFIHTFRDISERKMAEIRLREAMQQALAANSAKSEFLANMSHELRTPLNAIIGFSEVIRDALLEPIGKRYRDYASDIYNSGQHLLSVVNDVLDLAKIETGHFDLHEEEVAVADLVAMCLPIIDQHANKSGIDLKVSLIPDLPRVRADRLRLKQIVLNLLSNAVKFTPAGGRVTVSAAVAPDGGLDIHVSDTGIGMKPEELPAALEPFRQLESTFNRRYEGTGLGLPLARSLTELHGGVLEIDSEPGKGTSVRVRLPAHRVLLSRVAHRAATRSDLLPPAAA